MNAIDFLISEHEQLRQTLMHISKDSIHEETKQKLFDSFCQALIRHEAMEHQVWYPYFQNQLSNTVKHLLTEERHAERAIRQFDNLKTRQAWEKQFSKFRQEVEQHAKDEEKRLFPEVEKILSESDLEKIGVELYQYKKDHPIA